MAPEISTQNFLLDYFDAVRIPWRTAGATLMTQHGVRPHPVYQWDVVEIPTPYPMVAGLLWPLSFQVSKEISPTVPPTCFSAVAYLGPNAHDNFALTVDQLMRALGPGKEEGALNALGHKWICGLASLKLTAWPPEMQRYPMTNPAHERDPRVAVGCHISIETGYRPPASDMDRELVAGFVPIARLFAKDSRRLAPNALPAKESELEFVRQADASFDHCYGFVGTSSNRSTLIAYNHDLYVIAVADILQFEVIRIKPAKGSGGSWLRIRCRTVGSAQKYLTIASEGGADDLNERAAQIATATGKPLVLSPYDYDV
jgi:hypothetical protein